MVSGVGGPGPITGATKNQGNLHSCRNGICQIIAARHIRQLNTYLRDRPDWNCLKSGKRAEEHNYPIKHTAYLRKSIIFPSLTLRYGYIYDISSPQTAVEAI